MPELTASSGSLSVFINGGTSLLGRALMRQLIAAGHRVTATVRSSAEAAQVRADGALPAYPDLLRAGELRSAIAVAKANVVVNFAPTYSLQPPHRVTDWDAQFPVVDRGTAALLEAAQATEVEFLVQGSFAFLGGDESHHGDHEPPSTPFVDAARRAEQHTARSGVAACVLRFGFVYSAESPALAELRTALLRGRMVMTGSGHARANWIHAEDGARAAALALMVRPAGETLYVVDDRPMTPAAFAQTLAEQLGVLLTAQPPALARGLFANPAQLAMLEQPSGASNAETKARLDWTPQYPTASKGLEQALMVWRASEPIRA